MNTFKKTLVLGASLNPSRYSNLAIRRLTQNGHKVVAIGINKGFVNEVEIKDKWDFVSDIDTVTIYLRPERQEAYYEEILALNPKRIILNPGAENPELFKLASRKGIEVMDACNLVMLSAGTF